MLPRPLCLQEDRNRAFPNIPKYTESRQVNIFIITAAVTSHFERSSVTALAIVLVVVVIIIIIIIINNNNNNNNPFSGYDDC